MYGLSDVIDFFLSMKKNREKGQSIRLWTRHPCMYILGFGIHPRL